jgi:hypothetical protein
MLSELGFPLPQHVEGRATIADLFKPNERCGNYVLHFSNGEFYAGQAKDVTRRYVQHCNTHRDIARISFKSVSQEHLDEEERSIIQELEQHGRRLRNIVFTSIPKGDSDLDLVMPIEEQTRWLNDRAIVDNKGDRIVNPDLRRKFSSRFERFLQSPHRNEVLNILKAYVAAGIPVIRRGEVSFWCLSCMPRRDVYSRVNVYWQEVLTAFVHEDELWLSLHMARSPLEKEFGSELSRLFARHPAVDLIDHRYWPGGRDQTSLEVPITAARTFMADPAIITAIRLFNLRLMKKGPCFFGRFHCLDLADKVLPSQ